MKNQVIEVLDVEHGRKVIKYWKGMGVDTRGLKGISTLEKEFIHRYYGVIDGIFWRYSSEEVIKANAEIIDLPVELKNDECVAAMKALPNPTVLDSEITFTPNEDLVFLTHEKERLEKELKDSRGASESFATVIEQQDRDIKKLSDEVKLYVNERESMVDHINKNNKVITELKVKNEGLSDDKDYWFNEFNKVQSQFRKFKNAVKSVVLFIDDTE